MAFAIILLETFALYILMMACFHTDILAMRLESLGPDANQSNEDRIHEIIYCLQDYTNKSRYT